MWNLFNQPRHLQAQLKTRWLRLYRVAFAWCHDPDLSSDLVQEAMQKAIRKRHQLQSEQALDAWLFRILTNCWRDHCRTNRRERDTVALEDAEHEVESRQSGDESERALVVTQVRNAVAKLSMDQREVLTLVDLEGMSYSEVAEVLEIPIGTVMSRLCRARRQLREYLAVIPKQSDKTTQNVWRIK